MELVEEFVNEYERQYDFWEASADTVRGLLETELASSGLRAIVSSRAKSVDRLLEKLKRRDRDDPYASVDEIGKDIADLAGVRVALYFPGQMNEAERIIRNLLDVRVVKHFPKGGGAPKLEDNAPGDNGTEGAAHSPQGAPIRPRRFSGYGARHFRVHLKESSLSAGKVRYAGALVEVQVASVLMHAWSEVEHDLVYKPMDGELSHSEYALLDQLNGLVLAGEIALEQLQKSGDERVAATEKPFRSHFEFAEFLRTRLSDLGSSLTEATLGRVDVLFEYLSARDQATASSVTDYIESLEQNFEERPVAAQLADLMLSGDEDRYRSYLRAMSSSRHPSKRQRSSPTESQVGAQKKRDIGEFITSWVLLENAARSAAGVDANKFLPMSHLFRLLSDQRLISNEQLNELMALRDIRNLAVHAGLDEVSLAQLRNGSTILNALTEEIERNASSGGQVTSPRSIK